MGIFKILIVVFWPESGPDGTELRGVNDKEAQCLTNPRATAEIRMEARMEAGESQPRTLGGPNERLQKENVNFFPMALAIHTHDKEAPWFCEVPIINAIGAHIPLPGRCSHHQLLWVLESCLFIRTLALGLLETTSGNAWILCPSHQWPTNLWLIQGTKRWPPGLREGTLWCTHPPHGVRLRLDFNLLTSLLGFFPASACFPHFQGNWDHALYHWQTTHLRLCF